MYFQNLLQSAHNRIEDSILGRRLGNVSRQMEKVKTCCFFFNLKLGCKLIALFECICGLWQVYYNYEDFYEKDTRLSPEWIDARQTQHNAKFTFFMGLVALINSQLLLAGIILERKLCVLCYVYGTALSTVIYMFYTLVIACIPELLIFDAITAGLEAYFIAIALACYMQMRRAQSTEDDFEVLFIANTA